jgi:hypothetical protein
MSKNTDIKETVYRIREQHSCLTDQVNLMKADLAKVLREYAKAKIHRYNILTHWLFVAIELYAIIQGLRFMCHEGYPYWVGLSLVYMLAIVIWTTIKKLRNDGLCLDLKTYWDDEDKRLRRSYTAKSVVRMALILKLLQWQKGVDKHFVQHGVAMDCQCPNPLCISNLEPVRKRFENVDGVVRCVYCESSCDKA